MTPSRRHVLVTLAAAAAVRLCFIFAFSTSHLNPDSSDYLALADSLVNSRSYSLNGTTPSLDRAPGYPFFMALSGLLTSGVKIKAVLAAQAALDSVTAVYVLLLASAFLAPAWALAAALFYAAHPVFTGFTGLVLSETLFMHFWMAFLVLFRSALAGKAWAWPAAGLVLGLGVLTRPVHFFYPLPAAFLLMLERPRLKTALISLAAFLAVFAAVMTPWVLRNYSATGSFVLITAGGKAAVWAGSLDHAHTREDVIAVWPGSDYRSPEAERAFADAARKNWKNNWRKILLHMPHRLRKFWLTSHSSVFHMEMPNAYYFSTGQFLALGIKTALLCLQALTLAGALAGAWILRRHWRRVLFLLMPAAFVSAHILNDWGPSRYHISALPGLAILALWGASELRSRRASPDK